MHEWRSSIVEPATNWLIGPIGFFILRHVYLGRQGETYPDQYFVVLSFSIFLLPYFDWQLKSSLEAEPLVLDDFFLQWTFYHRQYPPAGAVCDDQCN